MTSSPAQLRALTYFELRKKNAEWALQSAEDRVPAVPESHIASSRRDVVHYGVICPILNDLYLHGRKSELPEETKQFLADESAFYTRIEELELKSAYPDALQSIEQVRLDMGAPGSGGEQPAFTPRREIPRVPASILPIITGPANRQRTI
jgi:hypothetical protein